MLRLSISTSADWTSIREGVMGGILDLITLPIRGRAPSCIRDLLCQFSFARYDDLPYVSAQSAPGCQSDGGTPLAFRDQHGVRECHACRTTDYSPGHSISRRRLAVSDCQKALKVLVDIPFNKPCMMGKERSYIFPAHAWGHLAGDGAFIRCRHRWMKQRSKRPPHRAYALSWRREFFVR